MSTETRVIRVNRDQVAAARALIIMRGESNVPRWYVKLANAKPKTTTSTAASASGLDPDGLQ